MLAGGHGLRVIARHLGWGRHTVQRYAHAATWQELVDGRWQNPRASILDPFKAHLDQGADGTPGSAGSPRYRTAALTGITAAVVGVIANLALYFAEHTLFAETCTWSGGPFTIQLPEPATVSPVALGTAVAALVMTFVLRWPMPRILAICAVLGLATVLLQGVTRGAGTS